MSSAEYNILFVCLGNICRSPMAEAVFKHTVNQRGLSSKFYVDSAGTAAYHVGSTPDSRSSATCKKNGVPVNHRARQVNKKDFEKFNYILCMDESNFSDLNNIKPSGSKATVKLFGEFDPNGQRIIKDPYYGGQSGFDINFDQVTRCSEAFIKHLGF